MSEDDGDTTPPDADADPQDAGQTPATPKGEDGAKPASSDGAAAPKGSADKGKAEKGSAKNQVAASGSNSKEASTKAKPAKATEKKPGRIARLRLFFRQVIAELRKVIWPTRKELMDYTAVVLVFVVIMALILAAYDFAFAKGVFFVFGE